MVEKLHKGFKFPPPAVHHIRNGELILSGPKGIAYAEVEVPITNIGLQAALSMVWNIYDAMPEPKAGEETRHWEAING